VPGKRHALDARRPVDKVEALDRYTVRFHPQRTVSRGFSTCLSNPMALAIIAREVASRSFRDLKKARGRGRTGPWIAGKGTIRTSARSSLRKPRLFSSPAFLTSKARHLIVDEDKRVRECPHSSAGPVRFSAGSFPGSSTGRLGPDQGKQRQWKRRPRSRPPRFPENVDVAGSTLPPTRRPFSDVRVRRGHVPRRQPSADQSMLSLKASASLQRIGPGGA